MHLFLIATGLCVALSSTALDEKFINWAVLDVNGMLLTHGTFVVPYDQAGAASKRTTDERGGAGALRILVEPMHP